MAALRIGLIGYGHWGPNLARHVHFSPECALVRIADRDPRRMEVARRTFRDVDVVPDGDAVTRAPDIDAVIIATPVRTHFPLALEALQHGKHVLVEKPMADNVAHCEELIREAERQGCILMVDHTAVYTDAVRWLQQYVAGGELGDPYCFESVRGNLGLYHEDASVLWDLAPHDLSILTAIVSQPVRRVAATGAAHAGSRVPDVVYLTLDLGDGFLAHIHVSWLSPVKSRRTVLVGSRRMIVFDDLDPHDKLKVYDRGVSVTHHDDPEQPRMAVEYRNGGMHAPALSHRDALQAEIAHFAQCIARGERPRTSGEAGLAVVRVLEAAQQSLDGDGAFVTL